MTTPSTPPPPAPVPPEGYRLLTIDERRNYLLPTDALYFDEFSGWRLSDQAGCKLHELTRADTRLHYATRAPLPAEPTGRHNYIAPDSLPPRRPLRVPMTQEWAMEGAHLEHGQEITAGPSSSESSGDVHLRQAREEVERLKGELAEAQRYLALYGASDHFVTKTHDAIEKERDEARAALAAAHTKLEEYSEEIKRLHWNMREAETQARTLREELEVVTQSRNKYQSDFERVDTENMELRARLATPSPAPVAVGEKDKNTCPKCGVKGWLDRQPVNGLYRCRACKSDWFDFNEKDSAGPTPRANALNWSVALSDTAETKAAMKANYHAFCEIERELTASESLRREASESLTNVVNNCIDELRASITILEAASKLPQHEACRVRANGLRDFIRSITPPVAEGGEG